MDNPPVKRDPQAGDANPVPIPEPPREEEEERGFDIAKDIKHGPPGPPKLDPKN